MGFCGGGCDGFVGHASPQCHGAQIWWYGGSGRTRSAEVEEDGAKTGPETNPSLPLPPSLPSLSHIHTKSLKSLLPEVPLTVASHPKGS